MPNELLQSGRNGAQWDVDTDKNAALVKVVETTDVSEEFAVEVDVASTTITYLGKAAIASATSAALWQVRQMTTGADGDISIKWADGDASFNNIWDNRAILSYS